nr:hypothetical protein [Tanacetum cinerariifolium]
MLNKENYVPWSSRLLRYAKSRPNGKLIHNSIINGPYVRRMIPEPGDTNREVPMNETFHVQTDDELTEKELKQIEADDQAIQTILLGLLEDIYAAVDSCETAQEIWLRVQQMMKGSDIGIQEKNAKLFNKWERFTSNKGESIESYYHPDYTQLYDFLKYNQKEVDELKAERLAKIQDPLALMMVGGNGENQFRQYAGQNVGNLNEYNVVQNVGNQVVQNAVQNLRIQNIGNQNGLIGVPWNANQNLNGNGNLVAAHAKRNAAWHNGNQTRCYNCRGVGYFARNCTVRPMRRDAAYLQTQLLIAQKEEPGIQLQTEEFDLMAAAADLDEIKKVNANYIFMANLQQASTSGTQSDKAPVYDSDGSAEVHDYENCDDNEIVNMFTQAEQYTELLEPILEQHRLLVWNKHDPPVVHDSEESLQLAQESHEKMKQLNKEIKPANYTKINHLSGDNTTPSVARKFLNEVKSIIVTLQRVAKHRMTVETYNWSSSAHQELHKIVKDENFPIVKQVDARVQNFEIQFLKEAAKFVGDFKFFAKEADESLAKHKALELEIERLLRAVVSQDIMSVVQKTSVVDTSNLQTELEPYKDMKQKIERLQAQLGDLKGKCKDTSCVSDTHNPLFQKLEITLNSDPIPQESKVMKDDKVIAPGMFRINPFKTSREAKHVPNNVRASARTKPITVSQPSVITKKEVNSDSNGFSSTGIDNSKTRRPQPRSNTKNERVPSASKSSRSKNKGDEVEEH